MHRLLLDTEMTVTADHSGGGNSLQHGSYSKEASFDTNMVIILAALLCALICALGLNSIVRCALRCSRRMAFETAEETAARLATSGVKKRALKQIPVAVYGAGIRIPATDCPICLGEFIDGEKVRILPKCNHGFHVRCIDIWFASHSSCPICRQSLVEPLLPPPQQPMPTPTPAARRSVDEHDGTVGLRQQGSGDAHVSVEEVG